MGRVAGPGRAGPDRVCGTVETAFPTLPSGLPTEAGLHIRAYKN